MDAVLLLDREVFSRLRIGTLDEDQRQRLFAVAVAEEIARGRIYDAHIGEVARYGGATVERSATHNWGPWSIVLAAQRAL